MKTFKLDEVEALRKRLRISQSQLCRLANLNATTYSSWMKFLRGDGGNCPLQRSLAAAGEALLALEARRFAGIPDPAKPSSKAKPLPDKADGLGSRATRGTDGCRAA